MRAYPEQCRIAGERGGDGQFLFMVNAVLGIFCQASTGMGWDHVSVSIKVMRKGRIAKEAGRCPNWTEMCNIKDYFFDESEPAMQLHPPKSEYVSTHPYTLHLWRPNKGQAIPRPPEILVGMKGDNNQSISDLLKNKVQ